MKDRPDPVWMRGLTVLFLLLGLGGGAMIGQVVEPQWLVRQNALDVKSDDAGLYYTFKGDRVDVAADAVLSAPASTELADEEPAEADGRIVRTEAGTYKQISSTRHLGLWSLLPALVAIGLCLTTKEPLVSLLLGIVTAALMLSQFDLTNEVLLEGLASKKAAGVLLLYLWLLGGLMGIWSRTGAAQAFADWASSTIVRGPKTAKLVAWGLGVLFFQGGTVSTVLVGTSVKPIADREKVSHEELSYVVDSTASPIAILLAFNAWPVYVQALIFVPGVALLATPEDRLAFFFSSLPLSFYAWFAVLGTLLLSLDKLPFIGKGMRDARRRARETGQLDRPGSDPMAAKELHASDVPAGYRPTVWEFAVPLLALIGIAVGTYVINGSPQVYWAFAIALLIAAASAIVRGMRLKQLMEGIGNGLRGVVVASVILLLAVVLGGMMQQTGGGAYLVDALGQTLPYWVLPAALMVMTMIIAFATGTSWGTFAVAFPLAMPLAWAVAQDQSLERPEFFLMVCFAAVLNGSVYGDQCSPISDTTILSSMTTGADLMDHVKTQIYPATVAATLAVICWEAIVIVFC